MAVTSFPQQSQRLFELLETILDEADYLDAETSLASEKKEAPLYDSSLDYVKARYEQYREEIQRLAFDLQKWDLSDDLKDLYSQSARRFFALARKPDMNALFKQALSLHLFNCAIMLKETSPDLSAALSSRQPLESGFHLPLHGSSSPTSSATTDHERLFELLEALLTQQVSPSQKVIEKIQTLAFSMKQQNFYLKEQYKESLRQFTLFAKSPNPEINALVKRALSLHLLNCAILLEQTAPDFNAALAAGCPVRNCVHLPLHGLPDFQDPQLPEVHRPICPRKPALRPPLPAKSDDCANPHKLVCPSNPPPVPVKSSPAEELPKVTRHDSFVFYEDYSGPPSDELEQK